MFRFVRSRILSFKHAFAGWWYVIKTQKNAWIHASITVFVILLAAWLRLSSVDWALILLAIAMVWTAEFMNTALEATIDLVSPDPNSLAKISKDVGAAAVMIAAGISIIIGFLIIGPPLWDKISLLLK